MDAQQLAATLRDDLRKLKDEKGINTIDSEKLILLLDNFAKDDNLKHSIAKDQDTNRQAFILSIENNHEWSIEYFRAAISRGESALMSAFLMNGGGTVALLAFMGQLAVRAPNKVCDFANSLTAFVLGVFFVVISYAVSYFSQCDYGDKKIEEGDRLRRLAIAMAFISIGAFLCGTIATHLAFKHFS